jgi:cytochrome c peroxidase
MTRKGAWLWVSVSIGLSLALGGCQPAGRYSVKTPKTAAAMPAPSKGGSEDDGKKSAAEPLPLPPGLAWQQADPRWLVPDVRIEFVHEGTEPRRWAQLRQFWTLAETTNPAGPASLLGVAPLHAAALALASPPLLNRVVEIKVPRGLGAPAPHIPASNLPTVGKWQLGKDLFFDDGWLRSPAADLREACAHCHRPDRAFTNIRVLYREGPYGSVDVGVPTLVNSLYNKYQFWDGRANALEEVVQRSLEDEREPQPAAAPARRHTWNGVVQRLRADPKYSERFRQVFGTPPTSDAIGKALATYLRTILSGNSLHDQAEQARQARGAKALEAADYEKVLGEAALKAFQREPEQKAELAQELATGYSLFQGQARCTACHSGPNFTDNGFHNLGIGDSAHEPQPGRETGRFAALPIGLKDLRMIGAYKTPTLRDVSRRAAYFHDGSKVDLVFVLKAHLLEIRMNPYLDAELRDEKDPSKPRNFALPPRSLEALDQFLRALDGEPIDPIVADPKRQPETAGSR